jgi:hypothetical protein
MFPHSFMFVGNPGLDPGVFKCRHFCFPSFEEASPGASRASMFLKAWNPALQVAYLILKTLNFFTFPKVQKKAKFGSLYREC